MTPLSDDWTGTRVCVAGAGVSGVPAARVLVERGAVVTVVEAATGADVRARTAPLVEAGATVRLGDTDRLPEGTDLVVTSPGWSPSAPLLLAAEERNIPVVGDVELAWRMRGGREVSGAPWLAVTGTNGKTTTVTMLASMLRAAGSHARAVGNVGVSLLDAVLAEPPYDVLAVELSSFQLHWAHSVRPYAGAVLNIGEDHVDWHGSLAAYTADKARIHAPGAIAVSNADDPRAPAPAADSARVVSFTLGEPHSGQLGIVGGTLRDRAFAADEVLAHVTDVHPPAAHNLANALAAAALARSYGAAPTAIAGGLRSFEVGPHRVATVATVEGVTYVDDSRATNPHAATAALCDYRPGPDATLVWVAGGQLKGADVEDLVATAAPRLKAAVLLGVDRGMIRDALARHAPNVLVVEVSAVDNGAMDTVVSEAARLADPGDTVLLAPAAASRDMFTSDGERGDAFAAAVRRLGQAR